ncbi:hypothetical protein ABPG72_021066 [Tetrahymena utriculariae]
MHQIYFPIQEFDGFISLFLDLLHSKNYAKQQFGISSCSISCSKQELAKQNMKIIYFHILSIFDMSKQLLEKSRYPKSKLRQKNNLLNVQKWLTLINYKRDLRNEISIEGFELVDGHS